MKLPYRAIGLKPGKTRMAAEGFRAAPGEAAGLFGIYAGWFNVLIGSMTIMIIAGFTAYGFGLFIKPVSEGLGISRANTNVGLIMYHLGSACYSPFVGRFMDRLPILTIFRFGALSFGLGFVGLGLAQSPLLMALLIVGPIALGANCTGALFANVLISRWFVHLRARALTIAAMGTSISGLAIFPIVALLISEFGWRPALIIMGVGGSVTLLILSLFARPGPLAKTRAPQVDDGGDQPVPESHQATIDAVQLTPMQLLRMRAFWGIAAAVGLLLGVDQALLATVTPYAQDRGFSIAQIATIMSATTMSALGGKLLIAWIADRIDLRLLLALTALCSISLCFAFLSEPGYLMFLLTSGATGLAIGGTYPLGNALVAKAFGSASVGAAMGLKVPLTGLVTMSCLYFVGAMHDRHGSYDVAMMGFIAMALFAIALMPLIPRTYKTPA